MGRTWLLQSENPHGKSHKSWSIKVRFLIENPTTRQNQNAIPAKAISGSCWGGSEELFFAAATNVSLSLKTYRYIATMKRKNRWELRRELTQLHGHSILQTIAADNLMQQYILDYKVNLECHTSQNHGQKWKKYVSRKTNLQDCREKSTITILEGNHCFSSNKIKTNTRRMIVVITLWVFLTQYQIISFIMNSSD